jgi:capsule polysaccharide export protein KpsE/RkpR
MGDNVFDPDPSAMVAAINQFTGLVQGLQGELHQVRAQLAQGTSPMQAAPSTSSVPVGVPTTHAER